MRGPECAHPSVAVGVPDLDRAWVVDVEAPLRAEDGAEAACVAECPVGGCPDALEAVVVEEEVEGGVGEGLVSADALTEGGEAGGYFGLGGWYFGDSPAVQGWEFDLAAARIDRAWLYNPSVGSSCRLISPS